MIDERIYRDYVDLFEPLATIRLKALIDKKEWILNSFYVPFSLEVTNGKYDGIECLVSSSLQFHRLPYRTIETSETRAIIDRFNERYRLVRLFKTLPIRKDKKTFFAQVNLKHLDKSDYKALVSHFFYCMPSSLFVHRFPDNDRRRLFQPAVEGHDGECVIIVDKSMLNERKRKTVGCFETVIIHSDMTPVEKCLLEEASNKLRIKTVNVNV